jgi:hypothetical protein
LSRYLIVITGESLDRIREVLDRAGIPSIGPAFAGFSGEEVVVIGHRMTVVVEAETPEEAERRLRASLPSDGDYELVIVPDHSRRSEDELLRKLNERAKAKGRTFTIDTRGDEWEAAFRHEDGGVDTSALNVDRRRALTHLLEALDLSDEVDRRRRQ